jgi:D-alanyl-D-alanine carboxypeptidase (penicillin-binding protein 5/6)
VQAAEDRYPRAAEAYLVKRGDQVLWAGNAGRRLPPASLAKLMTSLLVLERGRLDETVAVSAAAAKAGGTRMGLRAGERFTARDLLAATVVRSANDACRALADHVAADFVALMNARAAALGLAGTRYADPCGHDRDGQHTTAADVARLAEAVMAQPEYLRLARVPRVRVASAAGRKFELATTNALIGRYAGAIGLKTGYTSAAGHCLVALAERDGTRVLVVMLNSPNRWWNAVGLLDRAFAAAP